MTPPCVLRGISMAKECGIVALSDLASRNHFGDPYVWLMSKSCADCNTSAWPFANAVKAGVSSVMCSYNRINGSYGCQNSKLLNGVLKEELGFQGYGKHTRLGSTTLRRLTSTSGVRLGCYSRWCGTNPGRPRHGYAWWHCVHGDRALILRRQLDRRGQQWKCSDRTSR